MIKGIGGSFKGEIFEVAEAVLSRHEHGGFFKKK